ncbi:3-keto-5-aminohexanoate cleavage protein [Mesorhizobium sp. M0802]|uniref:3-keto-5-aminohexanoate cleavage protein n=1 Tax=Mesorhizobium sp. M0802 TaxID=2957001 RepID=UPI003336E401
MFLHSSILRFEVPIGPLTPRQISDALIDAADVGAAIVHIQVRTPKPVSRARCASG